jgi:hypothetical protein
MRDIAKYKSCASQLTMELNKMNLNIQYQAIYKIYIPFFFWKNKKDRDRLWLEHVKWNEKNNDKTNKTILGLHYMLWHLKCHLFILNEEENNIISNLPQPKQFCRNLSISLRLLRVDSIIYKLCSVPFFLFCSFYFILLEWKLNANCILCFTWCEMFVLISEYLST